MRVQRGGDVNGYLQLFASQAEWAAWLEKNYLKSDGLWLRLAKTDSGLRSVTYAEALEIALCYGWIDGQKRGESDLTWLQRFLPRTAKSIWSKINREKCAALIADGRMKPAGLAAVAQPRKMDGGTRLMTRRKAQRCRTIFNPRWIRDRGRGSSLPLSMAPTGTPCCFGFRP